MCSDNQYIMFKCHACLQDSGEKVSELKEIKEMLHQSLRENRALIKNLEQDLYKNLDKAIENKTKDMTARQDKIEQKLNQ